MLPANSPCFLLRPQTEGRNKIEVQLRVIRFPLLAATVVAIVYFCTATARLACLAQPTSVVTVGNGTFEFVDAKEMPIGRSRSGSTDQRAWTVNSAIVFVMHGVHRDAERYCHDWTDLADKGNFLVVCPQFLEKTMTGRLTSRATCLMRPSSRFPMKNGRSLAVEHLFDEVKRLAGSNADRYIHIWSFSGRAVRAQICAVYAAGSLQKGNCSQSWLVYDARLQCTQIPVWASRFRSQSGIIEKEFFPEILFSCLGESDVDPTDPDLNQSKNAEEEGSTRLERGQNYFRTVQATAGSIGASLQWSLITVPGAHHSDKQMSEAAAAVLLSE